ncbi:hypothetical protein LEMLEM_LOCUS7456, partial [Lemmus lemmus]
HHPVQALSTGPVGGHCLGPRFPVVLFLCFRLLGPPGLLKLDNLTAKESGKCGLWRDHHILSFPRRAEWIWQMIISNSQRI